VTGVAAPVRDGSGEVVAALTERVEPAGEAELVAKVVATAIGDRLANGCRLTVAG
jgi:DNA-binding IclR family transcriptional regulator